MCKFVAAVGLPEQKCINLLWRSGCRNKNVQIYCGGWAAGVKMYKFVAAAGLPGKNPLDCSENRSLYGFLTFVSEKIKIGCKDI